VSTRAPELSFRSGNGSLLGMRVLPPLLLALGLIGACASERRRQPAAPPPGPACGMSLYQQPACEATLDQGCCTQQQACMNDPACRQIIECWNYCEARRATEGCNCFHNCTPQGNATPGLKTFEYLASCSKAIQYPQGLQCRTGC
jgi:hypothetical protein